MIDFHTHILPRIDDGARSLEESLALLTELEKQGVDTVVLTPHYYGRNRGVEGFLSERTAAYERLREAYRGKINLLKGCECNLATCANRNLKDLRALNIEGTDYLLVEMAFTKEWGENLWQKLFSLMDSTGSVPVIAHIELYPAVRKNPSYAYRLTEAGCLLQINCASVINEKRKDFVWALLDHNQVQCLGSDTHNMTARPPLYARAAEVLAQELGDARVGELQENMRKIIRNEKLTVRHSDPVKKRWSRYV